MANEFEALKHKVAALEKERADLQRTVERQQGELSTLPVVLPDHERPVYEIINEAFVSPDDVYYPVGAQFADMTGRIIPNENMVPLNEPARERIHAWHESLPQKDRMVSADDLLQAAVELRPREGDAEISNADWATAVLNKAMQLRFGQKNAAPRGHTMPVTPGDVPIMSNTRIMGRDMPRGPSTTELKRDPINPADKAQPVIPRSELLGKHAGIGVANAR
jgi:hypothetical protein